MSHFLQIKIPDAVYRKAQDLESEARVNFDKLKAATEADLVKLKEDLKLCIHVGKVQKANELHAVIAVKEAALSAKFSTNYVLRAAISRGLETLTASEMVATLGNPDVHPKMGRP